MPLRGSVQLLLPTLRRPATRKAGIGAVAVVLVLAGSVQFKDMLPSLGEDGIAQALRQSVWKEALSGPSKPAQWPWEDISMRMSLAPSATVPRLGLSAAMQRQTAAVADPSPERNARVSPRMNPDDGMRGDVALGDVALGDVSSGGVSVGDSITFTAADGATCIYRVTGKRVVDPHLAANDAERFEGEAAMFECGALEDLFMQATQGKAPPTPADDQRKL